MRAKDAITLIVSNSVAPLVKDAQFKKSHFNFHRRLGTVVQVINIQLSQFNQADEGSFYVNVAFAFDELRKHENRLILEKPEEYECDMRRRLEHLLSDTPFIWNVSLESDLDELANGLARRIKKLLEYLNKIDSLSNFLTTALEEEWFAAPGEYDLMARMYDAVGKKDAAQKYRRLF